MTSLLQDRLDRARAASWRHPSLLPGCRAEVKATEVCKKDEHATTLGVLHSFVLPVHVRHKPWPEHAESTRSLSGRHLPLS